MHDSALPLDVAGKIGLAAALAVFMGLAFEGVYKREERSSPGGIRTFPTLTVLGTVLFLLQRDTLAPFLVGLAALGAWLFAYVRAVPSAGQQQPTFMVPVANLLAYSFGPTALTQPAWVVVSAAVAAVLLLESREALHRLVLRIPSDEVFTLGKFLILVGIILPLLPDRPIVSWTPITPFEVWLALVAVSSLSYASYLVQQYLPARSGVLWSAALGSLYSSTATTVALSRREREYAAKLNVTSREITSGVILATAIMFLRIDVIVALFNTRLALALLPALAGLAAVAGAIARWEWLQRPANPAPPAQKLPTSNPLQLGTAVAFAALFVVLAIASNWVRSVFGESGIFGLAALTGLTDIDPFVLSLAQGSVAGMSLNALAAAIIIAASSNNVIKGIYALTFGGGRSLIRPALALFAVGALGGVVALVYLGAGGLL